MGDRWVVGIKEQITDDFNRLWAISWDPSLNTPIPHNLTYTEDSGENWNFISLPSFKPRKESNSFAFGNQIFVLALPPPIKIATTRSV